MIYRIYYSHKTSNSPALMTAVKNKDEALAKAANFRRFGYIADVYEVSDKSAKKIGKTQNDALRHRRYGQKGKQNET